MTQGIGGSNNYQISSNNNSRTLQQGTEEILNQDFFKDLEKQIQQPDDSLFEMVTKQASSVTEDFNLQPEEENQGRALDNIFSSLDKTKNQVQTKILEQLKDNDSISKLNQQTNDVGLKDLLGGVDS
ncbi:MAG: hypothetical protein OIF32_07080 [Campylobacterales bacterium]|nr:hypothetical protein [Campylobacterales bacterium]